MADPSNLLDEALTQLGNVRPRDTASNTHLTAGKTKVRSAKAALPVATPPPITPVPTPPPAPTPPPPVALGVPDLFHGDTEAKYPADHYGIQPRHNAKLVTAPDGSGDKVWELAVGNNDGVILEGKKLDPAGETYSGDPRGQLLSPGLPNDQEVWWGGAYFLDPETFPASIGTGWLNLAEGPYAPPWDGSPPVEIDLRAGGVGWQTNEHAADPWRNFWRIPYTRGVKHTFLVHVIPSKAKAGGLVEMWHDGVPLCSVAFPAIDASNFEGPQHYISQLYYKRGLFGGKLARLWHWPMRLATTRKLAEYPA